MLVVSDDKLERKGNVEYRWNFRRTSVRHYYIMRFPKTFNVICNF